jgi:hypothetical protein
VLTESKSSHGEVGIKELVEDLESLFPDQGARRGKKRKRDSSGLQQRRASVEAMADQVKRLKIQNEKYEV